MPCAYARSGRSRTPCSKSAASTAAACRPSLDPVSGSRIGNPGPRDDQIVIPGVADGVALRRALPAVVGEQPDLSVPGRRLRVDDVVMRLVDHQPGRLPGLGDPQPDRAVPVISAVVPVPAADLDVHLKRHPLVRFVWNPATLSFQRLVTAVLAAAAVVHLGGAALVGVLDHDLELGAGVHGLPGPVALADDGLLPSASALVERVQELLGESLAPLDVELLAFAELDREVVGEVLPEAAGGIRSRIGRNLEAQRAGAGRL